MELSVTERIQPRYFATSTGAIRYGVPGTGFEDLILKPSDCTAGAVAELLNTIAKRQDKRR